MISALFINFDIVELKQQGVKQTSFLNRRHYLSSLACHSVSQATLLEASCLIYRPQPTEIHLLHWLQKRIQKTKWCLSIHSVKATAFVSIQSFSTLCSPTIGSQLHQSLSALTPPRVRLIVYSLFDPASPSMPTFQTVDFQWTSISQHK